MALDESLKLKIAASLDAPADSAADPDVARAIADDPEARAFATGMHTLERALQKWPSRKRDDASWDRLSARLDAAVIEAAREAKVKKKKGVSRDDTDPASTPIFEDDTPKRVESKQPMSEPQNDDSDLESLAALTRTSIAPSGLPAPVRSSLASISDATDDTSSGIIDIKALASMARTSEPDEKPAEKAEAKSAEKSEKSEKGDAKPSSKKDDVMVTPARAATPAPTIDAPPRKSGNTLWGAIGGMALMAGGFVIYNNMQHAAPNEEAAPAVTQSAENGQPSGAAAPESPVAAPPSAVAPAVAAPSPADPSTLTAATGATALPEMAAPPPSMPAAEPAAPDTAGREQPVRSAVAAPARQAANARGAGAVATRAPAPAAPTTAAARPAAPAAAPPSAAPAAPAQVAAARPATQPLAAGGHHTVDDLMGRITGGANAPAAAAPVAAAAELPERPTRAQMTSVLSGLNSSVRTCANGQTGTAPVSIVIGNDGAVRTATVSGQFAGSSAGECIAGVVRRAHFPAFRAQQVSLTWPFVILPPR